jgi:site-specific DNA-cytosine methylase
MMRTISLFSGCGGIDLALERAGFDVTLQAEKDPQALSVLRKHWPDVKRLDDVHSVRPGRRRERIDLIAGGFPCQDLSVAGKRAGLAGKRSGLWWEFHRIIREFSPAWVLSRLIVAPDISLAMNGKSGNRYDGESETFIAHSLRGEGFDASEDGTGRGTPLVPVAFAQNSRDEVRELGDNIAGALSAQPGMKQQTYLAFKESQSGTRVSDIHATLDSNKGSRRMEGVLSGYGVRRLMPIECERCQGMPDDFTRFGILEDGREVELSDSARYRLIGNSVAVPTVEWIGRRIMEPINDT